MKQQFTCASPEFFVLLQSGNRRAVRVCFHAVVMKHLLPLFAFLVLPACLSAQLRVGNGITLGLNGNIVLTVVDMDIDNQGSLAAAPGSSLRVQGAFDQYFDAGGDPLQAVVLDKSGGLLVLQNNLTVLVQLNFGANGNRLLLGDHDLVLGAAATVSGHGPDAFVVTNGAGEMAKQNLDAAPFTFPVGHDANSYTPLTLTENGAPDEIGVRCLAGPLANGASGAPIPENMAGVAWEVSEATAGGSNLDVTAQWAAPDELPGFVRADCGIARYNTGVDWDLPPAVLDAASGANPYTRTRTGLSPGVLAVADDDFMNRILLSPKIMLAGPYSAANNNMNDLLRSLPDFPLTAPTPYGSGKFTHAGRQPAGGYAIDPAVLTVTGNDAIVDWVFLWLKDPANPATNLQTQIALLQKDGDIVALDGASPVRMPGNADQPYLLGIGHRNHLSVRSAGSLAFSETVATFYDFTSSQAQAYGTNPMRQVDSAPLTFALIAGNANGNTNVRYNGASNDRTALLARVGLTTPNAIIAGYYLEDLNLNGEVKYNGSANDRLIILSTVGIGTPNATVTEQF